MEKSEPVSHNRVFVVGVGMTKFLRPGKHKSDYPELSQIAVKRALRDSALNFESI